jgi:hypothetical protein
MNNQTIAAKCNPSSDARTTTKAPPTIVSSPAKHDDFDMTANTPIQRTEVMLVTPSLATSWLQQNIKFSILDPKSNRTVRQWWVNTLAERLKTGQWKLMAHGVAFAPSGRMLDGQHRLKAIEKAGIPALMNVHWNFDEDTFGFQDGGISRSVADRVRLPRKLVEIVRLALQVCYYSRYDTTSPVNVRRMAAAGLADAHDAVCAETANTAVIASSSSRLMVCTLMVDGADADYTRTLYQNLCRRRFNDLPPIANVFASQAEANKTKWTLDDKNGLMARVRKVFDPRRQRETRLSVVDSERQAAVDYVKAVLKPRYEAIAAQESNP